MAVRLFLWWFTVGTNDVATWASHGQNVGARGLAETYRTERLYNHPPLIGLFAAWAVEASGGLTLPFARLIKLPSMLGEAVALAALWRWGGVRLAAIYALLPAPILVAAYHGNTDCLYAAFALLAALAWERRRFALAGLALAAALNVKLIPLVLLPLYVIGAPSASALLRFGATL
ncbi:MAG TPA: glycosyltransferase 87 family protein, partial [Planctomycetota bacterium]|nr:glycosyltransferase 87 family protein [Planctomycetota bacterium]